jgi:tetratricopeptide (TPR) repeat protein
MIKDVRVRALSSRGLAYIDLGRLVEARVDLQEIVRLSPRSSSALVNLAKAFAAAGSGAVALDLYEKALAADVNNFDGISGIVKTSIQINQPVRAHTKLDELIGINAGKVDVLAALHYLKSTVFAAEKNGPAAENELLAAIDLDENYLPAYSAYASLLFEEKRTDEAAAQYKKALGKRPAAQVYTMLGILEESRGNTAEAESSYRKALDVAPESPIAANNLAWLIADTEGNLDEALQLANMAVTKEQSVAGFYDTLGWVYWKKGLISPAVEQFKKAECPEDGNETHTWLSHSPRNGTGQGRRQNVRQAGSKDFAPKRQRAFAAG